MQADQIPPLQVYFDSEFSFGGIGRLILFVLDAHFVFWTAASFKTLLAQSFHFWPAAARRQALRSDSVPRTLTGNATRSPSAFWANLLSFGAGILVVSDDTIFVAVIDFDA